MKKNKIVISLLVLLCVLATSISALASDSGGEPSVAQLQQQIQELKRENKRLRKENKELKAQLGMETEAETEAVPELGEDVANADTTVEYTDTTTVQMVQIALNDAGYNCGTADGKAGPKTKEQITLYQTDKGLTVNGIITDQLIVSLGLADKVSENAKAAAEKATYSSEYSYDQLARTPDTYEGAKVKFTGEVVQVLEDSEGDMGEMRLAIDGDYGKMIYVAYKLSSLDFRLLEEDNVTIYAVSYGMYTYETVMGGTVTLPLVYADYVELN